MHRIDSATARQDANGTGKTGFHDNADLPNQDATYFTPEWANALQEEIAGVIEGLELTLDKTDNGQLLAALVQQFGEKKVLEDAITEYKEMIEADRLRLEALEARTYEDTQVGELFWTAEHFLTPEAVTTYKGYGTWKRALQGRVAVGFSDIPEDHIDFRTVGAKYGEREHTLTVEEMPAHKHSQNDVFNKYSANYSDYSNDDNIENTSEAWGDGNSASANEMVSRMPASKWLEATEQAKGGNEAHNNMPPAKTLDCWQRVS